MKVSVEQINGTPCTVIRRPFDPEAVRASLAIGVPVVVEHQSDIALVTDFTEPADGGEFRLAGVLDFVGYDLDCAPIWMYGSGITHTLTILPALPRYPTAADAPLLYRYAAEGLYPATDMDSSIWRWHFSIGVGSGANVDRRNAVLSHCVTAYGERVEVAIV